MPCGKRGGRSSKSPFPSYGSLAKVWRQLFRVKKWWNIRFRVRGLLDRNLNGTGMFISMMLMVFIFGFAKNIYTRKKLDHSEKYCCVLFCQKGTKPRPILPLTSPQYDPSKHRTVRMMIWTVILSTHVIFIFQNDLTFWFSIFFRKTKNKNHQHRRDKHPSAIQIAIQ